MKASAGVKAVLVGVAASACAHPVNAQSVHELRPHAAAWERLAAAEDARAATPAQLQVLLDGVGSPVAVLRLVAVRGLGRLERAELAVHITPLLRDTVPTVRAAAAHALGQAVVRGDPAEARASLAAAPRVERDAHVIGALAETLGRLRHADAAAARATVALLTPGLSGSPPAVLGTVRGLYHLARQPTARSEAAAAAGALRPLTSRREGAADDLTARRIRRLAVMTIVVAGAHDDAVLAAALRDADTLVRREAAAGLNTLADTAAVQRLLRERVLADTAEAVRYEGVRAYARRLAPRDGCGPLLDHARDRSTHVALLSIDLLRTACPRDARATTLLDSIARSVGPSAWHRPAHALVSLSARDAAQARALLPRFATHRSSFARTYAATAAGTVRDTAALLRFAADAHANVRTAAVDGLHRVLGRGADSVLLAQLALDDSQLLQATAAALDSIDLAAAAPRLLDALDRITAQRSETSRDARTALLQAAQSLGSATLSERVRPYLTDFDPQVAALAADVLQTWTGTRPTPRPNPLPAAPLPTFADAARMDTTSFVVEMEHGSFELRLLPFAAPTNAARFARLARAGYFDGLTFHRVVANFIVQGGSPGANEYAGDRPYTRDELDLPNWRGTVGLSTRGRDTGDGQIYINTVDNVRLDHEYTVFAEVVRGMEVVDAMQEGARIRRISEMSRR